MKLIPKQTDHLVFVQDSVLFFMLQFVVQMEKHTAIVVFWVLQVVVPMAKSPRSVMVHACEEMSAIISNQSVIRHLY